MVTLKKPKKVLVIGSGPIVIGQSAEFDYSGTQACRALREEGVQVVLVNSNPATIQTDKDTADIVYIEPLTASVLEKIIAKEKPEALIATMGGQTGLNLSMELVKKGILEKYNVRFLGTNSDSIEVAESREHFNRLMEKIHVPILPGRVVHDYESAKEFANKNGYPVIIRPSFTLGGTGGGTANSEQELEKIMELALRLSATNEALVERSVIGWGEFEYEVIRDSQGNAQIICNMENIDPMGIHTGESIVVAPSQTLSDVDHQTLREASLRIVHAIGIEGGCNVQLAMNQQTGDYVVIEVNPRLSRSSALASKATGYPIARVATKIALGYSLPEIKNAITGTSAAFEPALDYVVVKIPRWPFDKFPKTSRLIGTQMKSTGEVMAIGRTFQEALNKALRSLEIKIPKQISPDEHLYPATDLRIFAILEAFRKGRTVDDIYKITKINKWFLRRLESLVKLEKKIKTENLSKELTFEAKRSGFSDLQIANLKEMTELEVRSLRKSFGIIPTYKIVDSCAGEFEALTPYYYSVYEQENEASVMDGKKVVVIGSGPIRIGQGIEFDYCCSQAAFALRDLGYKSIMINNNPETVSTDFDSSDRLYFEPLTFEDVMNIIEHEKPFGVVVQLGGQTSINLAEALVKAGAPLLGTSVDGIDIASDRDRFRDLANKLKIPQPKNGTASSEEQALSVASEIGYPVVVRPSYVIAGRAMEIVRSDEELRRYITEAVEVSQKRPVLIDRYLDNAIECEVDAVSDGTTVFIGGLMEHVEPAGIHSGDANIVLPSIRLTDQDKKTLVEHTEKLCKAIGIIGLVNVQYVVKEGVVYILEVNPRASRTVPFVSKAIDIPMTKLALKAMLGEKLPKLNPKMNHFAVKSVVFPFLKLLGTDIKLGPEMRSTGETMGIGKTFEMAYYKALLAAGIRLREGKKHSAFISLNDEDKKHVQKITELLKKLDFTVYGTMGTVGGVAGAITIPKIGMGSPDVVELIESGIVDLVINTPTKGGAANTDGYKMRRTSILSGIPCITNVNTAYEFLKALVELQKKELDIRRVDQYRD
ncbi:Pyruvate carboxylase subunit A [Candidatus Bilamarchaeum dharawalense]|uniref:Carbamoyl phosphate synthase large chain n=1 Tax=Candidatus Bilamarchaeum dharawalense TaxID=2885759 RepID=A0A5E4LQP3_9ARCH|nr:Pyruvate carboxylase subunit A [Candidatus Bilamarchaeum dharawalense]